MNDATKIIQVYLVPEDFVRDSAQIRDRLKIKAIENNGYTPYVVKDLGGYNPDFVKQQFGDLVNWLSRGPHKAK